MTTIADFNKSISERTKQPLGAVKRILRDHHVEQSVAPPRGRPLRVRRIAYAGEKLEHGLVEPFEFEWKLADDGLWIIATDTNSAGKTTTLQVALWAMRGAEKHMSEPARSWIKNVAVDLEVDGQFVAVAFSKDGSSIAGEVKVGEETLPFASAEEFEDRMQGLMLARLDLETLAASQAQKDGSVSLGEDGWTAYTGAFLSDAKSNAIIGESYPGVTIRLLEVFVGLPWVTTVFQAHAASRAMKADIDAWQKRLEFLGGKSIADLEGEIQDIDAASADAAKSNIMAEKYARLQKSFEASLGPLRRALAQHEQVEEQFAAIRAEAMNARKAQLLIEQGRAATEVIGHLDPKRCPHCSEALGDDRRTREASERVCQLCVREIPERDDDDATRLLDDTKKRVRRAIAREKDAELLLKEAQEKVDAARRTRESLAAELKLIEGFGTDRDIEELRVRRAGVAALLMAARDVLGGANQNETAYLVLQAAEVEARERADEAAKDIMSRVSSEITSIVRRIGMPNVDRVTLKRNTNVDVEQGGGIMGFGKLSPGQQLRLRIATVLALIKSANERGVGRHPGLLLIDSPGNEEMDPADLSNLLREVSAVANDVRDVQIIVAMRGVDQARAIAFDRTRVPIPGQAALW